MTKMVGKLGIQCCLDGEFGQHARKCIEIGFGFKAFNQSAASALSFFSSIMCLSPLSGGTYQKQAITQSRLQSHQTLPWQLIVTLNKEALHTQLNLKRNTHQTS